MENSNKLTRKQKLALLLSQEQKEIIHGCMLGDLHAERRNLNGNTRLQFKYSIIYSEYVDHLFNIFKIFTGTAPINLSYFDSRENKQKTYESIKFQTFSLPCFNIFREVYYNSNGIKIIPNNIENLLTARGLAHWIMDDGYNSLNGLYLCTESFSKLENELLIEVLKNKFNLECGLHKHTNGFRIYIWGSSKQNLVDLVKPYFLPSLYYKLNS